MPGIYSRDNLAQQLAQAIEMAQQRRERNRAIEAQRNSENVKAATDFAKALGRTYETWDGKSDEDKLIALQQEREEAIKAQQEHDDYLRGMLNREQPSGPSTNDYYAQAMQGYTPASSYVVPNYSEVLRKRGLY